MMDSQSFPIAVIGIGCRFPGDADCPDRLWRLAIDAKNTWSTWPEGRLNESAFYDPKVERLGTFHSKGAQFLNENVAHFDASFFNMSAEMARAMDPQVRMLLETAFEAFESAGLALEKVAGSRTAVFAGALFHDYNDVLMMDVDNLPRYAATGNGPTMIANRISHFFDLRGTSITVDTACSTAMAALHMACLSLQSGDAKMAVVGGTNLLLHPGASIGLATLGFLGASGKSYSFDSRADGYGRGEGVGCIIVKPLADAIKAGDPIRAIIRGTGMNQDGRTPTISSPSQTAQEELIRHCYASAGLDPKDTPYIEAHGTGTIVGDKTEATAIGNVFGAAHDKGNPIVVGSIKSNIGHAEAASGIAAIAKVVKMFESETIPPLAIFEKPNPQIDFEKLNIAIPTQAMPWPDGMPRRASIANFGVGGSNTHAILEDPTSYFASLHSKQDWLCGPTDLPSTVSDSDSDFLLVDANPTNGPPATAKYLLVFSNRDRQCLNEYLTESFAPYLQRADSDKHMPSLAYTLCERRSHFSWRTCVVADSVESVLQSTASFSHNTRRVSSASTKVAFVFTGQGAQWARMGYELIGRFPVFSQYIQRADKQLRALGASWDIYEELARDSGTTRLDHPYLSFPVTVILQIALTKLLGSWGISPAGVTGHSSGEIAAAYAAGALGFKDAISIAYYRGKLTSEAIDSGILAGAMASIGLGEQKTLELISATGLPGAINIACINSPSNVTVSGDELAVRQLGEAALGNDTFFRELKVPAAYHSHHMTPLAAPYEAELKKHLSHGSSSALTATFASPVTGLLVHDASELLDPLHWVRNMTQPVLFSAALTNLLSAPLDEDGGNSGIQSILEIGPHGALQGAIQQILRQDHFTAMSGEYSNISVDTCLKRRLNPVQTALEAAGRLYGQGYPVDLHAANFPLHDHRGDDNDCTPDLPYHVIGNLPHYQWNHTVEHWVESSIMTETLFRKHAPHDLFGVKMPAINPKQTIWRNVLRLTETPWLQDHAVQGQVLFPGVAFGIAVIEAAKQLDDDEAKYQQYELQRVDISAAVVIPSQEHGVETQLMIEAPDVRSGNNERQFTFFSRSKEGRWTSHCTGALSNVAGPPTMLSDSARHASEDGYLVSADPEHFYDRFSINGPTLGRSFQNITNLKTSVVGRRAVATITVPNAAPLSSYSRAGHAWLYPGVFDACFQVAWAAVPNAALARMGICVLRRMEYVYVDCTAEIPTSAKLEVDVRVTKMDRTGFQFSLQVRHQASGSVVLLAKMIDIQSLSSASSSMDRASEFDNSLVLQPVWRQDINTALSQGTVWSSLDLSPPISETNDDHSVADVLKGVARLFSHKFPHCRILEIGAGAGDATLPFLQGLVEGNPSCTRTIEYVFTDQLSELFGPAREKFSEFDSSIIMTFQVLDIDDDPLRQGLSADDFDLVLVSNVLSSCPNPSRALAHIRKVMKTNAIIVMTENIGPSPTAGLSSDCDETKTIAPLTREACLDLLTQNGFSIQMDNKKSNAHYTSSHAIFLSRITASIKNSIEVTAPTAVVQLPNMKELPTSFIDEMCESVTKATGTDTTLEVMGSGTLARKIAVVLVGQEGERFLTNLNDKELAALQRTVELTDHMVFVSLGVDGDAHTTSSLFQGLCRTLRLEERAKTFVSLCIESEAWDASCITGVCNALQYGSSLDQHGESELWQRGNQLCIPRLAANRAVNRKLSALQGVYPSRKQTFNNDVNQDRLLKLSIGSDIVPVFSEHNVKATDWTNTSIAIQPLAFSSQIWGEGAIGYGFACIGTIVQVGNDVPAAAAHNLGDLVFGIIPSETWSNKVYIPWTSAIVVGTPVLKTDIDALARLLLLIDLAMAWCILSDLCCLEEASRILIHGANSVLGKSLLLMSRYIAPSCYIIGVVASEEERDDLNNMTIGVNADHIGVDAKDIHDCLPDQQGIDVIIDCSAYSNISSPTTLTSLLVPFGRYLQFTSPSGIAVDQITAAKFVSSPSFSHIHVDIRQLWTMKHKSIVRRAKELLIEPIYTAVSKLAASFPKQYFSMSSHQKALHISQTGPYDKKVVIQVHKNDIVEVASPIPKFSMDPSAQYLIVGGLGGIGLEIALYLASCGAKKLILTSRSAESQSPASLLDQFAVFDTEVVVRNCDVAQRGDVENLLRDHGKNIRGVIQAAAVLQDSLFSNLTCEQWKMVMAPKVLGSQNLDAMFSDKGSLDFFIIISSLTAVTGNVGQANYTAAGAYQDALAIQRVKKGLPAVSINIGSVPDLGFALRSGVGKRLSKIGCRHQTRSDMLQLVRLAIQHPMLGSMVTGIEPWMNTENIRWREELKFACSRGYAADRASISSSASGSKGIPLQEQISGLDDKEATRLLVKLITQQLSVITAMPASDIDPTSLLSGLGIDSLVAVELRALLQTHVTPVATIFDITLSATLTELASKLMLRLREL